MDYKNTIDSLLIDIQEIKNIIEQMKEQESIAQIDIDLSLSKIRRLYEVILFLKQENRNTNEIQEQHEVPKKKNDIVIEKKQEIEEKVEIEKRDEEMIEFDADEEEDIPEPQKPLKKQVVENTEIIADKFKSSQFRNETIAEKTAGKDISSKIQSKPIDDIKRAIGLNDKFLFIKELFDGDSDLYNEAVNTINQADNYIEALNYMKANFTWDYESDEVTYFLEIVKRKFALNL